MESPCKFNACPHCGDVNVVSDDGLVICLVCGSSSPDDVWNMRHTRWNSSPIPFQRRLLLCCDGIVWESELLHDYGVVWCRPLVTFVEESNCMWMELPPAKEMDANHG